MADVITVTAPGLLTTVQDTGRFGYQAQGFSPSGAMDFGALRIANLLVGNSPGMPALEMTMQGIVASFGCDCVIALTGADFGAKLNSEPVPTYQALVVQKADVLQLGAVRAGLRGYLAIAGGFHLEPVLGSCSTNLKCALGGFAGRKLKAGDALPLRCPQVPVGSLDGRVLPVPEHLDAARKADGPARFMLRAVPGPQDDTFTAAGLATFFSSWYAVTPASDRMGVKLEGAKIESRAGSDIISDGIAAGSVQVPAAGIPIIMTADRQTTGGYAKIATVITPDLDFLAQACPGDWIRFTRVSVKAAQNIARCAARGAAQTEYRFMGLR
jgi:biotin-dependent carboxylase-like uncharacterized protein